MEKKPFEIARETLKQLTARKMPPTPLNYQTLYSEVSGVVVMPPFPADRLREITQLLPTKTPGQQKQRALLESAINQMNWEAVKSALLAYAGFTPPPPEPPSAASSVAAVIMPTAPAPTNSVVASGTAPALTADFFEQIARLITYARPALGTDDQRFNQQADEMVALLRQKDASAVLVKQSLATFGNRLSFAAEEQVEIRIGLLKLLNLIVQNIGELSLDDQWLKGQIDTIKNASLPPLTLRRLDEVERLLKDVIYKQTDAKGREVQAHAEMRQMLASFIARLSQMTESTSAFHSKMDESARLIEQAKSLLDITPVLKEVVGATRSMTDDSLSARDELRGMREKALNTEAEIAKLHEELDRVSTQARHDSLTGALNRKGLDEAMLREVSNVRRKETPLCIALLDIDNFKKINDRLGHATGDDALTHLAAVAREVMRPQDTLARYGGEEFVLLLPDTALDRGIEAMTRLQRELTKRFFMAGAEKVLITFSAGVAQLAADETGADAIKRADHAMYLAKRAGKNRVLGT